MNIKFSMLFVLVLLANLAFMQTTQSANDRHFDLTGMVVDSRKVPVNDVIVTIKILFANSEFERKTSTDKNGKFEFRYLDENNYQLIFDHVSYKTIKSRINLIKNTSITIQLEDTIITSKAYVVTGTRTMKEIKSNPVPTELITQKEIKQSGNSRLDEVIGEQTGFCLIDDHGKGVQIQGLDASFALILVNSEPVIGTMTGKLNLERFTVQNIKKLEVVKGPSSSLYGSNALAGVINLITERPSNTGFGAGFKYGKFNTIDLSVDGSFINEAKNFGISIFGNRLSSDGFQLTYQNTNTKQTLAAFKNYTLSSELFYSPFENTELVLRGRYNQENQKNQFGVDNNNLSSSLNDDGIMKDYNLSLNLKYNVSPILGANAKFYYTGYSTETQFYADNTSSSNYNTNFNQNLFKGELVSDYLLMNSQLVVAGIGTNIEKVSSDIISEGSRKSYSYYGFLQDDYMVTENLNIIASIRFDGHSDYSSSLNPKIAFSHKFLNYFTVRASVGSGYKAPTFEQLFLNWTNPTSGYSVFGVTYLKDGFQQLLDKGYITNVLISPSSLGEIKPENSWSYNAGASFDYKGWIFLSANYFRNNVRDLIDFLKVAEKSNGQGLFTYANYSKVHTEGLEAELHIGPVKQIDISIGYQYLKTVDEEVLAMIRSGQIWKKTAIGTERPVKESEYGGLFNRSANSGNFKIRYNNESIGFSASLRGIFRGEYGYSEASGNSILDDSREYAPGYAIWNLAITQELFESFNIQAGIKNILDKKDQRMITYEPGRTYFVSFSFNYNIN